MGRITGLYNSHTKSIQSQMLLVILLGPFHCADATFRTCGSRPNRPKLKTPRTGRFIMGRITGLEPATFGTTNQRSNQLSYIRHTVGHMTFNPRKLF